MKERVERQFQTNGRITRLNLDGVSVVPIKAAREIPESEQPAHDLEVGDNRLVGRSDDSASSREVIVWDDGCWVRCLNGHHTNERTTEYRPGTRDGAECATSDETSPQDSSSYAVTIGTEKIAAADLVRTGRAASGNRSSADERLLAEIQLLSGEVRRLRFELNALRTSQPPSQPNESTPHDLDRAESLTLLDPPGAAFYPIVRVVAIVATIVVCAGFVLYLAQGTISGL